MSNQSALLLYFAGFFLVAFQTTQSSPINSVDRNSSIIFKLNETIQINGTDFNELNCVAKNPKEAFACSIINEVTCLTERFGEIKSCSVSNDDSLLFGSSVTNETIVCNDDTRDNCRLIFSPELSNLASSDQMIGQFGSPFDDDFERRRREFDREWERQKREMEERQKKWDEDRAREQRIIFIVVGLVFGLIIGVPVCCIVLNVCNDNCCDGRIPFVASCCEECEAGGGGISSGMAGTSYRWFWWACVHPW